MKYYKYFYPTPWNKKSIQVRVSSIYMFCKYGDFMKLDSSYRKYKENHFSGGIVAFMSLSIYF